MFNNEENKDKATITTASAASYYIYIYNTNNRHSALCTLFQFSWKTNGIILSYITIGETESWIICQRSCVSSRWDHVLVSYYW